MRLSRKIPKANRRALAAMRASIAYHAQREAAWNMRQCSHFLKDPNQEIAEHASMLVMHYMAKVAYFKALRAAAARRIGCGTVSSVTSSKR